MIILIISSDKYIAWSREVSIDFWRCCGKFRISAIDVPRIVCIRSLKNNWVFWRYLCSITLFKFIWNIIQSFFIISSIIRTCKVNVIDKRAEFGACTSLTSLVSESKICLNDSYLISLNLILNVKLECQNNNHVDKDQ